MKTSGKAAAWRTVSRPGFVGPQPGIHRSVLRQAALQPADAAGKAIHRIPHLEARDALPHLLHHAGEVHAHTGGQWLLGVLGGAGADLGVQRVHAAGVDADKHLLAVRGSVPGARGGIVLIKPTRKGQRA